MTAIELPARNPEAIVLIGIQATGKTTFCLERFGRTHVRISLDQLGTRFREKGLFELCLQRGISMVIDNTNPGLEDRARYLPFARAASFRVRGYYFESKLAPASLRNAFRGSGARVPDLALKGTAARLVRPSLKEGFDELSYVRLGAQGFVVEEFRDDV